MFWKIITKIRLPKDIASIFIIKPIRIPKKNPELINTIMPPGNESAKKKIEMIKYMQTEYKQFVLINSFKFNKILKIISFI